MDSTIKPIWARNKIPATQLFQAFVLPLIVVALVAAILIFGMGLEPAGQLARGILYSCLFLACIAVAHWRFSLAGVGISSKNIGRGFLYGAIIFITSLAFMFALQPPKGLAHLDSTIWALILFYLAVSLAEETWFRGLIFKSLYDWGGPSLALSGSAILFGLMHVPTRGWEGLLFSLSIGLPYAVVRLRTDNILSLITLHWLTNLTDSFVYLSAARLATVWLSLSHVLVFASLSISLLLLDRKLRGQQGISL